MPFVRYACCFPPRNLWFFPRCSLRDETRLAAEAEPGNNSSSSRKQPRYDSHFPLRAVVHSAGRDRDLHDREVQSRPLRHVQPSVPETLVFLRNEDRKQVFLNVEFRCVEVFNKFNSIF